MKLNSALDSSKSGMLRHKLHLCVQTKLCGSPVTENGHTVVNAAVQRTERRCYNCRQVFTFSQRSNAGSSVPAIARLPLNSMSFYELVQQLNTGWGA